MDKRIEEFKIAKANAYSIDVMSRFDIREQDKQTFIQSIEEHFFVGFDFGVDAGNRWPDSKEPFKVQSDQPDWFADPEKLLDLVEGMLSRIGKIRYPVEGEPTPEQKAEYELDDRRDRVNNLALRLMDMPHLYGEYLQRDQVFDMAIRDAIAWDDKIKEAVK